MREKTPAAEVGEAAEAYELVVSIVDLIIGAFELATVQDHRAC